MATVRKKLILLGATFVIALLFCELLLRIFWPQPTGPIQFAYDPVRGAIPVPNQTGRRTLPGNYDYTFANNSLGLRGREIGPKNRKRILLLGDSFTYGYGVNDGETFASQLEQLSGFEVINAGNGGTGTDYALRFYETLGRTLQPDLIILCFFPNDFSDNDRAAYYNEDLTPRDLSHGIYAKKEFLNNRICDWFLRHSHLANLIKQNVIRTGLWQVSGPVDYNQVDTRNTAQYLNRLADRVHANGSQFAVVYIPSKEDVEAYQSGRSSVPESALKSITTELSVTPALASSGYPTDRLYRQEGHWSPESHRLAAEFLNRSVAENLR